MYQQGKDFLKFCPLKCKIEAMSDTSGLVYEATYGVDF